LFFHELLLLEERQFSSKEIQIKAIAITVVILSFCSACMDSVEPAGPAQYENPEYPSEYRGYALIPTTFSDVFFNSGRIFVIDRSSQMMFSFSADDPNLADPDSLVHKDTLHLGFPAGLASFDSSSGFLFITDDISNDIYLLEDIYSGTPQLLVSSESLITEIFPIDQGSSLLVCFLGPEWLVRKIDTLTGQVQAEYSTGWPITRAALSSEEDRLLLSNSGRKYLIEIDTNSFQRTDSISLVERTGPFLYNSSGDIVLFNQYSVAPRVSLFDADTHELLYTVECINPYKVCSLIPGTDTVLAPRRSDNKVSVLNSETMIFAPSVFCFSPADLVFVTDDRELMIVASDNPGRIHVFENVQ